MPNDSVGEVFECNFFGWEMKTFFGGGGEKAKFFSKEHVGLTCSFNIYLLN